MRSGEPGHRLSPARRLKASFVRLSCSARVRAILLASLFVGLGCVSLVLSSISSSAYVSHSPILIASDSMFDGDHGVTGGSGVAGDPWVISNWDIGGDASDAIVIMNTSAHFAIRGVYLHASTLWNDKTGVHLYNVTNGSVESSLIQGEFEYGVHIEYSADCSVVSNNISDVGHVSGVCAEYSMNVTVVGNQMSNCGYGVRLVYVDMCAVSDNTVTDGLSYPGIHLYDGGNCTISGNSVDTVYEGIQIWGAGSKNVSITGNTVMNCTQTGIGTYTSTSRINISGNHLEYTGVGIQQADGVTVANNRFLNMSGPAIYLSKAVNVTISANEMQHSSIGIVGDTLNEYNSHYISLDNTVNGKPVRYVKDTVGFSLDGAETGQLIVVNCTNMEISNISVSGGYKGIDVVYCRHVEVRECNVSDNTYSGVYIRRTENITVSRSRISGMTTLGVYSSGFMKNATFSNNTITQNENCGMKLWYATQVDITGNIIVANGLPQHQYGIELYNCVRGNVTENHIADNYAGMILSVGTVSFRVFHNNFVNNTYQAWDVMSNIWDDGYPSGGNYWDNYTGSDGDADGIGDSPYVIDSDSQDNYPLMEPIPEFSDVIVPVVLLFVLVTLVARMRRRN